MMMLSMRRCGFPSLLVPNRAAFGHNRARYFFIPGGMISGVLIIGTDSAELDNRRPFLLCARAVTQPPTP
jgi:hypothetical protein